MKLAYFGVFLLSVTAFPAAANRVMTTEKNQTVYSRLKSVDEDRLFCNDRISSRSRPEIKEGVIVKMKPFVVKEVIHTETFKR